ncbi:hypothetical protein B5X24_HaOG204212 [Helicoverpa armigera]|nr:hypothetical protein B5X24_HaOG204212 [Helicoverpa armigera]
MCGIKMLAVLYMLQSLQYASCIFFHEPSAVIVAPYEASSTPDLYTDFGFTLSFSNSSKTIVIGAPTMDHIGKVYGCETRFAATDIKMECDERIMPFDWQEEHLDMFPNQRYYLGGSIAATSKYIFACAPLWTQAERMSNGFKGDAFGTCLVKDEVDTNQYRGIFEQHLNQPTKFSDYKLFSGGTGWSTLVDEENDLLIIVKTSLTGDIVYVPASEPLNPVKSMMNKNKAVQKILGAYWNLGYGITSGKFFSKDKTYYAFSMTEKNMEGAISFLRYEHKLLSLLKDKKKPVRIDSRHTAVMFGTTLSAADLNLDGLDELLVGAPAHYDEETFECGAVHIYLGGDMSTITSLNRVRTILGISEFGRFGTAIASMDIDGDSKGELVISAPYEDDGLGAIYILSGYEIYHTLMKTKVFKSIHLSELKMTQRVQKKPFRNLGFSLQFVDDVDFNGCSELVAGAPGGGRGRALVFKCFQTINVTISSEVVGEQIVREQDTNFTVKVCARVQLKNDPKDIVGNITVVNSIRGEATHIPKPNFIIDLTCFDCQRDQLHCEFVTVELKDKEPRYYTFTSKAELQNYHINNRDSTEFNTTWVVTNQHSKLENSIAVSRHCKGNDCIPKLSMDIIWNGSKTYLLGSSANETVTIRVRNDGNASYESCVWLRVSGAPLGLGKCDNYNGGYTCDLDKPLKRETQQDINLLLNMTTPTNMYKELLVDAYLYENCNQKSIQEKTLQIPFTLTSEGISINQKPHVLNTTDKLIAENATIYDNHEYVIRNNDLIKWEKVQANFTMEYRPYFYSFKVTTSAGDCERFKTDGSDSMTYNCTLLIKPYSTQKIIGTTEIFGKNLETLINEKLNTKSILTLDLDSRVTRLKSEAINEIKIERELTLSRNKLLISLLAVFIALILLAILIFVLYKCGFFYRKQQRNLLVMKESIRRKSIRQSHVSGTDGPVEGLQMDVDDDPFDDIRPVTTNDDANLVDEKL